MRKIFGRLHLYLSIPFGILISLICITGALLVFESDIMRLVRHEQYYVDAGSREVLPLDSLLSSVESVIDESAVVTGVTVYPDSCRTYEVSLSYPRRATVFVNQYTGEFLGYNKRLSFFEFTYSLHRWLLDERTEEIPYTLGRRIVGVSVIVMLFILLSGIVIWIPRTLKSLKNRLSVCTGKGLRRLFYDFHVSAGFYSFVLLTVLALTGLTWSFPVYRTFIYRTFGDVPERKFDLVAPDDGSDKNLIYKSWDKALPGLRRRFPCNEMTFTLNQVNIRNEGWGNHYASDICLLDSMTGSVSGFIPYDEQDRSVKIKGWILSLHLGLWGGVLVKSVTFIVALIGAALPLTGYYIWYRKLKGKSSRR